MAKVMGSVDDEDPNVGVADFQDIELFLAEHVEDDTAPTDECFDEKDVADILAERETSGAGSSQAVEAIQQGSRHTSFLSH